MKKNSANLLKTEKAVIMKNKISSYIDSQREDFLKDLKSLVDIKSVREAPAPGKPFGEGPARALGEAIKISASHGFDTVNFDNYAGEITYGKDPVLMLLAFIETNYISAVSGIITIFTNIVITTQSPDRACYIVYSVYSAICTVRVLFNTLEIYKRQQERKKSQKQAEVTVNENN